jgi:hypothetical protein
MKTESPDPQKKQKVIALSVATGILVIWMGKQTLPVFFPSLFTGWGSSSDSPPPPPPPSSSGTTTTPPPPSDSGSSGDSHPPEYWASQALESADRDFSPEKIAAEPAAALRVYVKIVLGFPDCPSAKAAATKADDIRSHYAAALDTANKAAEAALAAIEATDDAKLKDLDHTDVIGNLQAFEDKNAGLPAAEKAKAERTRVQGLWNDVSKEEKDAHRSFQKLPKLPPDLQPGQFADDLRISIALRAQEIATTYSNTLYGERAVALRDALLGPVADEVEAAQGSASGTDLARRIPKELKNTPAGRRIAAVKPHAGAGGQEGK